MVDCTSAAPDQAAARRQLEALAAVRSGIDFGRFDHVKKIMLQVDMTEADELRHELVERRLARIAGLTEDDVSACKLAVIPHLSDDECRELLEALKAAQAMATARLSAKSAAHQP